MVNINPYKEFSSCLKSKDIAIDERAYIGTGYGSSSNVNSLDGDIAEFVIFDRLVDQNEHHQITHYFSNKWGLTAIVDSDGDGLVDAKDTEPKTSNLAYHIDYNSSESIIDIWHYLIVLFLILLILIRNPIGLMILSMERLLR